MSTASLHPSVSARRYGLGVSVAVVLGLAGQAAFAQAPPAPLSLPECISIGMENQPALAAAGASLSSAESGLRSIRNMRLARLLSAELRVRQRQACLGVEIASAGLQQAEWETRYAVTRNFYSVLYARQQRTLVAGAVKKLEDSKKKAKELVDVGDPKIKVTSVDVDVLAISIERVKVRQEEAAVGAEKALAALREAMGVERDFPLDIQGQMPALLDSLDRGQLVDMGLTRRGEMAQAQTALDVTGLEVLAQRRVFGPTARTFAAGSDVHARPIPQGVANTEYRPGAIGLEIPTTLVGKRPDRVAHAGDFEARAGAVVDKTRNLIVLEVEAAFWKWKESFNKVHSLRKALGLARSVAKTVKDRFDQGAVSGEELIRTRGLEDQTEAELNEALYNHALALAAIERVTAGGFVLEQAAPAKLPEK
jgi:outer membrane protein TolC